MTAMADDTTERNEAAGQDVAELDLDAAQNEDLDAAMRAAVAAVEEVESGGRHDEAAGAAGSANSGDGGPGELAMLRRELADLRNRSMRTLADFDNFRKRSER
jgi:molecular chaperone GrpE (heat shock protein)